MKFTEHNIKILHAINREKKNTRFYRFATIQTILCIYDQIKNVQYIEEKKAQENGEKFYIQTYFSKQMNSSSSTSNKWERKEIVIVTFSECILSPTKTSVIKKKLQLNSNNGLCFVFCVLSALCADLNYFSYFHISLFFPSMMLESYGNFMIFSNWFHPFSYYYELCTIMHVNYSHFLFFKD